MPHATAAFEVQLSFEPPYAEDAGVKYGRATVTKTFSGDVEGASTAEMLSVQAEAGSGYVALERVIATVDGKRGSFALLHVATMIRDAQWGRWPIVAGSGTGELSSIRGEGRIDIAEDGSHTLHLEYELG